MYTVTTNKNTKFKALLLTIILGGISYSNALSQTKSSEQTPQTTKTTIAKVKENEKIKPSVTENLQLMKNSKGKRTEAKAVSKAMNIKRSLERRNNMSFRDRKKRGPISCCSLHARAAEQKAK